MKKTNLLRVILVSFLALIITTTLVSAQSSGGYSYLKKSGVGLVPKVATWELGTAALEWAKGYFTAIKAGSIETDTVIINSASEGTLTIDIDTDDISFDIDSEATSATGIRADFQNTSGDLLNLGVNSSEKFAVDYAGVVSINGTALSAIYAATDQTMYIGTTGVAINRNSAALTLAGITLTTPVLGVASATSLQMANDSWLSSVDNAGTGSVNMFKVNTSDEIDVGATFNIGPIDLAEDSGAVNLVNLPVSDVPADEVVEGYGFSVDSNLIIQALASADSAGGVYGERLKVNGSIFLNDAQIFVDSDATPDVRGYSNWETNTTGVTITDFDWGGKTIPEGQLLVIVSKGAIIWDVTASGIKGGTTDITTAAGDVTTFIYDGADWLVIARMDMSDDLN